MSDVVTLYAGQTVALHRDFTKLTMKLRPVSALPYFLFTSLVDGNNLDFDERRFGIGIRNCHGTRRAH
jgi:hypothetical protein